MCTQHIKVYKCNRVKVLLDICSSGSDCPDMRNGSMTTTIDSRKKLCNYLCIEAHAELERYMLSGGTCESMPDDADFSDFSSSESPISEEVEVKEAGREKATSAKAAGEADEEDRRNKDNEDDWMCE